MQVKDVMTKNVETLRPDSFLDEVAKKMRDLDVGVMPIMQGEKVLGLITDRDIVVRAIAEGKTPMQCRALDILSGDPVTIKADADIEEASSLMEEQQIRRLVVVDQFEKFCGMISLGDIATNHSQSRAGEALEKISEPTHVAH